LLGQGQQHSTGGPPKVEKDTKNTRRYLEEATDGPQIIGTLYLQQWALRKLTGGDLPERVHVTVTVAK